MSAETPGPRRSNYEPMRVSYGAIGASKAADLMKYPPEGFTPFEEAVKLGSGHERFLAASTMLMTWQAQTRSGGTVSDIVLGEGDAYLGIEFAADGTPKTQGPPEQRFGADGEPYLTVGTRVNWAPSAKSTPQGRLVVYTVDEPRRVGFAWGSTSEEEAIGEEVFVVEHRTDDSVWAVVRGFVGAASSGLLGHRGRTVVKDHIAASVRQIRALAPGGRAAEGD